MYESPGALERPAPTLARSAGGECPIAQQQSDGAFGDLGGSADDVGLHTMWGAMGKAVRAELRLSDGTVRPAGSAQGYFFFWYRADRKAAAPLLVGYDSAGNVVGEQRLPDLITGEHGGPP